MGEEIFEDCTQWVVGEVHDFICGSIDGCTIQFDFLEKSDILVLIKEIEILLKNMEDFYEKNKTHL